MGLDIYLYRYENFKKTTDLEAKREAFSEKVWNKYEKYEQYSDAEKEECRKQVGEWDLKHGFKNHEHEAVKSIEINSSKHPEHLFKIGYFRSSYNDGGINRILENLVGFDLYGIFNPNDAYTFQPDWTASLKRIQEGLETFEKKISDDGAYRCFDVSYNEFNGPPKNCPIKNEQDALKVFFEKRRGREKIDEGEGGFQCREGHFFLKEPLKVAALIEGVKPTILGRIELPSVFVVFEDGDGFKWYREAMEIMAETCEWVLSQPDKDKYYLHWSG